MNDALQPDDVIGPDGTRHTPPPKWREAVMAVPNLAKLLGRLMKDPRVSRRSKVLAVSTLAYVVSPIDLLPDVIPVVGQVDDIILLVFALNHLVRTSGEHVIQEHWDGDRDVLEVIRMLGEMVSSTVPKRLRRALEAVGT